MFIISTIIIFVYFLRSLHFWGIAGLNILIVSTLAPRFTDSTVVTFLPSELSGRALFRRSWHALFQRSWYFYSFDDRNICTVSTVVTFVVFRRSWHFYHSKNRNTCSIWQSWHSHCFDGRGIFTVLSVVTFNVDFKIIINPYIFVVTGGRAAPEASPQARTA